MAIGEGATFGRYRILGVLGTGGMGHVYRAFDTEADRVVALKVLPQQLARDEAFKERLRREAAAGSRLDNPHVVPVHHFGEVDGQLYLDMRLVDGPSLAKLIRESRSGLDPARAVAIVAQIASALTAAHRVGLVHRDVKPSNVLLTEGDYAYLIDFGLVRASEDAALTATGFAMGTVAYMAPEQLQGDPDARSDVYALACVLFECLTGHPPFPGDMRQKIAGHMRTPPPVPSRERPELPIGLDAVIARGMAKDPGARYQTALQLADAAQAALQPQAIPHAQPGPPPLSGPVPRPGPPPVHRSAVPQAQPMPSRPLPPPPAYRPAPPSWGPPPPMMPPHPHWPPAPPRKPWWRRSGILVGLAALLVAIVVVISLVAILPGDSDPDGSGSTAGGSSSTRTGDTDSPSEPIEMGAQSTVPFGSFSAMSLGVDDRGKLYLGVIDDWILELPAGSSTRQEVRLSNERAAAAMAVAGDGTVYFIDLSGGDVFTMPPNSSTQDRLPFDAMDLTGGIAVGSDGTVYVADPTQNKLFALEPGASRPKDLGVSGLDRPTKLAVGPDDTLYFDKGGFAVQSLAKGETAPHEVAEGFNVGALAADAGGNVYVANPKDGVVVRIDEGSSEVRELPFTGLTQPMGVTVDSDGNVYVLDFLDRVLKLAPP